MKKAVYKAGMDYTNEQIHIMLLEKIAGTIDPADDRVVEQLLRDDSRVCAHWLSLNKQVEQATAAGFSVAADEEQSWQAIKPLLGKHRPLRLLFWKVAGVAALVAAIFAGISLFGRQKLPIRESGKATGVTLAVEEGTVIRAEKGVSKTVSLDGTTLRLGENTLIDQSPAYGRGRWRTLSVPAVLDYKVWLADGSQVWLNAETSLRFPSGFPGKTREVYIDGEAFFTITKNTRQPFIVHTPQTDVVVSGTQFNVNTYNPDHIKTALVEGSIITKGPGNGQVAVLPGYQATYTTQNGFQMAAFDDADVLSWMKGVYYFHHTPLQELAGVLSRWYGISVHFDNFALQKKTFSGALTKSQPLQLFLESLQLSANVHSVLNDNVLYLK